MARYPRRMPANPRLFTATVARTERISPSFQRVTLTGGDLAGFGWLGLDQWFRLFLPPSPTAPLRLPKVSGRSWYRSYLQIPAAERPHCSNYTVADFRRGPDTAELDLDVVLHWHGEELGGAVAAWAAVAQPGSPVGLLDQGVMFDPPQDAREYVLVADETGLPAVRGVLRDLPASATGVALLEVPTAADAGEITAPPGLAVLWLARDGGAAGPGCRALDELRRVVPPSDAYAFVVGESGLATGGRRVLKSAGLSSSRITFSGFWRA